jgi:hypothetical protein
MAHFFQAIPGNSLPIINTPRDLASYMKTWLITNFAWKSCFYNFGRQGYQEKS